MVVLILLPLAAKVFQFLSSKSHLCNYGIDGRSPLMAYALLGKLDHQSYLLNSSTFQLLPSFRKLYQEWTEALDTGTK